MIERFPQFLQRLVLDYNVPFKDIISLSKTCVDLNLWMHKSFKAYNLLYIWYITQNTTILKPEKFYQNNDERRLFQIIYKLSKNKMPLKEAYEKYYTIIIEWYLEENLTNGLKLESGYLNLDSQYDNIKILDWWINTKLKYPNLSVQYTNCIDSTTHNIDILNWWLDNAIKYPHIVEFKYSEKAVDNASYCGNIDVLNWWLDNAIKYPHIISFKYLEKAVDNASYYGKIDVLNWWLDNAIKYPHLIEFEYSTYAIDSTSNYKRVDVLNWWLDKSKKYPHLIKLKYSTNAIDYASQYGYIDVLDWWLNSGLRLKYSFNALDKAIYAGRKDVIEWWKKSGLPIKLNKDNIDYYRSQNPSYYSQVKYYSWLTQEEW